MQFETNKQGEVLISDVEEGSHQIRVNYKDYVGRKDIVLGGDAERHNIEIQMQIEAGPQNPVIKAVSNTFDTILNTLFGWIPSVFGAFSSR